MDLIIVAVFVAGLFLGTLLNVVIIRLPREQNMVGWPRCTRCGRPLAWWQVLPIVGWAAQAGRARCCGRSLSALFPLIELLSGAVLAIFYAQYGLSISFWYMTFVAAVLILTGAIDWLHRSIYTFIILGGALVVLIVNVFVPLHDSGLAVFIANMHVPIRSFQNALLGALTAGFVFALFFVLARMLFPGKSSPFGLGDVYLGIFIGAAVGLSNLLPSLFYGMLLAGVFSAILVIAKRTGRRNVPEYISYGTFLCMGALGYLLLWGLGSV